MSVDYQKLYLKYKSKYTHLKLQNMKGGDSNNTNTLFLFKADWCGHCRGFKPTWEKLQNDMTGKIKFVTVDADKDKDKITEYKIDGFPTLILKTKDNNAVEYVGTRDLDALKDFVKQYSN